MTNKEALNIIGDIDLQQYDYETELFEGGFSPIYVGECYRDEFEILQQAIDDLELYKKALEIHIRKTTPLFADDVEIIEARNGRLYKDEDLEMKNLLNQAKQELEDGKPIGVIMKRIYTESDKQDGK